MFRSLIMSLLYPAKVVENWLAVWLSKVLLSAVALAPNQSSDLLRAIGQNLSHAAWKKYNEREYFFIEDSIELMERAWAVSKEAEDACRLGLMNERANRNLDALKIYKDAFRLYPQHAELRYQAAISLLRHGSFSETRDFFESVRHVDPGDPFMQFATAVIDQHEAWVVQISQAIRYSKTRCPPLILSFAVWGEPYVVDFVHFACAALLAPGNLPAVADRYSIRFVIFTTAESEKVMRAQPIFERLLTYASFHFVHFDAWWLRHSEVMVEHYGARLGRHYATNCKFLLFSGAHYAALEAGRRVDALVMPLGADNVVNNGALACLADIMAGEIDAVVATGFRVRRSAIGPEVESKYRDPDGVIRISSAEYGDLLVKHIPENNFVDSGQFTHFPLILGWKVEDGGVLVHSNHYHPCCIRAGAIKRPVRPTIDPIDGRFMQRYLPNIRRIHIIQDTSVVVSDWGEGPLIVDPSEKRMSFNEVSLWLWMYWDSLRDPYFRAPIRLGRQSSAEAWEHAEREADELVDSILAESSRREAGNRLRGRWQPQ